MHSANELRLAQLLLLAEQAEVGGATYERIRERVCMLYKPLTGKVELSASDIGRMLALLEEIENEGFCCWAI